jgi:methylase of polypeptide subunit release factors
VAHDPDPPGDLWPTHVAGPTPAGDTLADLTVRRPVASALDVGSGSGVLSLLAARHATKVLATDINPAAIAFTALNAELNGLTNIETREGNLFEPAAGTRHDLVVSNPPFVIAPDTALVFRHSPMARDDMSRAVVRGAAAHVAEGGFAHILCNWISASGASAAGPVEQWVEGSGCDALVLVHGTEDPLAYAVRWNLRTQQLGAGEHAAILDSWLDYFAAEGIDGVTSGAVILRRRDGRNWVHALDLAAGATGAAGSQIVAIFRARDYLATVRDDQEMLDHRFAVDAPHRLDQALVSADGGYVIESAGLVLQEGLGNRLDIEPDLIPVLLRFDGSQTVAEIVSEVAEGTGVHRRQLTARTLRLVRALLEGGFAEPRPGAADAPGATS